MAWAIYLGCSWTWCIGMFLPVLLVRDWGIAAWFVFAVPNVVGAAAMGWVLARPGDSQRLLAEHRAACVGFSVVTLAFHAFFLTWLTHAGIIPIAWAVAAVVVGTILGIAGRSVVRIDWVWAVVTLAISLAVLGRGLWGFKIAAAWGNPMDPPPVALPPLALVCLLGFLLCPYLDVTFHRAAMATAERGSSRLAFSVGFGVFFLAMIFLTLLYAGDFNDNASRGVDHLGSFGLAGLGTWVALHLVVQIGFTWGSHLRALPKRGRGDWLLWVGGAALAAAGIFFTFRQQWFDLNKVHLYMGEFVYRIFMSFYGLVFPAYVWLVMMPLRRAEPPRRRAVWVWVFAVIAAAPAFWLAFVVGHMLWLIAGVAVVMMARALVGKPAAIAEQAI